MYTNVCTYAYRHTQIFGFISGRSTTNAIHLIRRLIKLCQDKKGDLCMLVIDVEKVHNIVSHEVLWGYVEKKGVH